MIKRIFAVGLMLLSINVFSQGIRGKLVDDTGLAVPGASIYFQETRTGTTSNNDGLYEIALLEGVYTMIVQSLGYSKQEFRINMKDNWIELDITLNPINFRLKEVTVYAGEDPAYPIMRKAIGLAPYFLRQVKNYEAEVYLKGSFALKKLPKIFQKMLDKEGDAADLKVGQTYTSESLNKLKFSAPDTIDHKVLASQNSFPGDNNAEGMVMGFINLSFYDTKDNELYISPLSPQAFKYYNFRYEGFFDEGKYTVNRIKVIPKRKSQQLLEGELYIIENLWCIHSANLAIETFYGKMKFRQLFSEVKEKSWLAVNHIFSIDFSMLGIKGDVNYTSAVKYLSVNVNDNEKNQILNEKENFFTKNKEVTNEEAPSQPLTKNQKKIEEILSKEELKNQDMIKLAGLIEKENKPSKEDVVLEVKSNVKFEVVKDSIKRDSLYWSAIRPIPLTAGEKFGYEQQQIKNVADTTTVNKKKKGIRVSISFGENNDVSASGDSAKIENHRKHTFRKITTGTLFGATYPKKYSKVKVSFGGLINIEEFDFNPVDGWKYGQNLSIKWSQKSYNSLNLSVSGGYAFNRKVFHGNFNLTQYYCHQRRGELSLTGNIGSSDYNDVINNHSLFFAGASLLFKENYPRFYENKNLTLKNKIDFKNGLQFEFSSSYRNVAPLINITNFSFFYINKKYHPNEICNNEAVKNSSFEEQKSFSINAKLNYTPMQRYYMFRGKKIMLSSDYPTFTFEAKQGIKAFLSHANYLMTAIGAYKKPEFSFLPVFSWNINAGKFFINKQIHFSEFQHFNTVKIPLLTQDLTDGFFLIDSYEASTDKWFLKANGTFTTSYLMIKYLPFLSNRMWSENIHINYLYTPDYSHYTQIGYSIGRIYMLGNIGVFAGFNDLKYKHWGVRVALVLW